MKKGFTLLELIIFIATVGILAAIVISSFSRAKGQSRAKALGMDYKAYVSLELTDEEYAERLKKVQSGAKNKKKDTVQIDESLPENHRFDLGTIVRHKLSKQKGQIVDIFSGKHGAEYQVRFLTTNSNVFSECRVREFELEVSY